ncbi:MAG TPA: Gfo/Idh/MocA family oxidoreductase [Thermotogota bacterium]|nr:Gfo/Idh/MocA family oxidoreductase [Thermotogota bacterium]HRW34583.1 Gfo/Idh/MocA family oxidoreductase [Thermotogota bacterium]
MSEKLKWGILGTANIARKALIPGILASENGELYALAGRKKEKVEEFENLFKPKTVYHSYEELLKDDNVQAVYIPLPNALHLEWVIKALESGKNVLCEKPIALDEFEAQTMFNTAFSQKKVLMEAFAYIHNPLIKKMKEIIEKGSLGEIKAMDMIFTFDLTQREKDIRWSKALGGGAMYDLGCYTLHLIRHLAGKEPSEVKSFVKRTKLGVDESTTVIMNFDQQFHATFHVGFTEQFNQRCQIHGSEGSLITPFTFNEKGILKYYIQRGKTITEYTVDSPDNYLLEATHFANVVSGKEQPAISIKDSVMNASWIRTILNPFSN